MAQARILADLGCDTLQGYVFAKPMPAQEFFEFSMQERFGEFPAGPHRQEADRARRLERDLNAEPRPARLRR